MLAILSRGNATGLVQDRRRRQRSERLGRVAETVAAGLLMLKGYRILARRISSPFGEVDLVALRGRRLAFVEVKYRSTMAAAKTAVTHHQSERMANAAERWIGRRPGYRDHHLGLDAIYLAPWRLPLHVQDALH